LLGELDAVRSLAESLQAQNHEASNRLHTVVSLIEIGRPERAREFAVSELQFAQAMTDRVVGTVGDPVLASLLLAKLSQAQERGVVLTLELGHEALNTRLPAQDVVTVVATCSTTRSRPRVADRPRARSSCAPVRRRTRSI